MVGGEGFYFKATIDLKIIDFLKFEKTNNFLKLSKLYYKNTCRQVKIANTKISWTQNLHTSVKFYTVGTGTRNGNCVASHWIVHFHYWIYFTHLSTNKMPEFITKWEVEEMLALCPFLKGDFLLCYAVPTRTFVYTYICYWINSTWECVFFSLWDCMTLFNIIQPMSIKFLKKN